MEGREKLICKDNEGPGKEGDMPEDTEDWLKGIEPVIESQEEILLAGCPQYGDPDKICPGSAWERLFRLREELGLPQSENMGYGVEVYPPGFEPEDAKFYYFAGFEATPETRSHPGFFLYSLLECRIAVFTMPDNDYSRFPALFSYAYSNWLPGSGYELAHSFDFERYISNGDRKTQVCLPVVRTG